jgi:signal transduction histidine kinase/DNA-binding response OmpR family regulator
MIGFGNKEYIKEIVELKQQLNTAPDDEKIGLYESIYNRYARMGLLLEAEKITLDLIVHQRARLPKNKIIVEELRLCKLLIDNGKVQQGLEHLEYSLGLCDFTNVAVREDYLAKLMGIYYSLSLRDEKYKVQYQEYLSQYETQIKPQTTVQKLDYYMELSNAYFNRGDGEKGREYKNKLQHLLEASPELSDAYKDRFKNYLYQLSIGEMRNDPDQHKLINHAKALLEQNKTEKFLHSAGVFFWLRAMANAYAKLGDVDGLKKTFSDLYFSINEYVEENIDIKIYEQKYQSDYFLQEQKLKDSQEMSKVKDSVFSNFNHELRTPLNIILSNCELITRDINLPEAGVRRLGAIQNQSYNLLNIIDQFIEINKTNLQFNQVNNEVGDLVQFLQLMETDFATLCEQKDISLKLDISKSPALICELDFAKLERVLYNLLTNAVKFTAPKGKITLKLSTDKKTRTLTLQVTDTGIGIAKDELETIFAQFYSAKNDSENIKNTTGFGIGLYLVKQLVELLSGTISVKSELGKGSTFTVKLPLVELKAIQQNHIGKRLNYKQVHLPNKPKTAKPNNYTNKPRLLIVEDNMDLLEVITASLEGNYTIKTAGDGQEAKELLATYLPDLVITDLMMPRMNGIELTTHIKQDAALNHLPVIMLTAKGSLPNRIKGWEAGIDVFLRKPFSITELEHCIHNTMHTRTHIQERIEALLASGTDKKVKLESPAEKFVGEFKYYVLSNISTTEIHNAQLAKHLNVDENSMYRKIKALTGYSPIQLITKLKILRAMELIESKQYSTVKEVAYSCGFNDPKYFSKVYKAETGDLPKVVKR